MQHSEKGFFRRIRVSGGMTLQVFQDRILNPCIGWANGYHGYLFTDNRDGVQWGPKKGTHFIDMMHIFLHGYDFGDDTEVLHLHQYRQV